MPSSQTSSLLPTPQASNSPLTFSAPGPVSATTTSTQASASEATTDLTNGIDAGYPLTKTGRKKRGCDDNQDENEGYANDPPEDSKHPYKNKAYHIRRAFSLFADIHAVMNDGIKRRAREALGIFVDSDCIQSERDYETFKLITNHLDGLDQDIIKLKRKPKVFRKLVRGIRQAADQGRNNDTANLKKDIACMLTEDGTCVLNAVRRGIRSSSKSDRGFYNDVMGRYLCPITLDWDDHRVRQEIRDGKHAIQAHKVPRLLYANCECNVDDLERGLGRNLALLKVVKYIFTGCSSAFSTTPGGKTTRAGNAALAGMKEITPRVVAYSACMLRFAISTEESWSKLDNEFNMEEFYWYVVDIFDDAQEFGRNLLAWWNMQVFGTSTETAGFASETLASDTDFISLLKQQRAAKRARVTVLHDSTNTTAHFGSVSPAQPSLRTFESELHTHSRAQVQMLTGTGPFVTDSAGSDAIHNPHNPAFATLQASRTSDSVAASSINPMEITRATSYSVSGGTTPSGCRPLSSHTAESRTVPIPTLNTPQRIDTPRARTDIESHTGNYSTLPVGSATDQPELTMTHRTPFTYGSDDMNHSARTSDHQSYGTTATHLQIDPLPLNLANAYHPTGMASNRLQAILTGTSHNLFSSVIQAANVPPTLQSRDVSSEGDGYDALLKADALLRTQVQA